MPVWGVSEPYINLWLKDEPLGYQPALGPRISAKLAYKRREATAGLDPKIFGAGKQWNFEWFSFVTNRSGTNFIHFPNGRERTFSGTIDYLTNTRLTGNTTTGYTLSYPDGSQYFYGFIVTNSAGTFLKSFLSEVRNPQSQKTRLEYFNYGASFSPVIRLKSVIDGDGRTNSISYVTNNAYSTNLIRQIVDPYGRTATFAYDSQGRLTNIVDVAGISSSFGYKGNVVTNLATPYGNTSFSSIPFVDARNILVTQPDGGKHFYFYQSGDPELESMMSAAGSPSSGSSYTPPSSSSSGGGAVYSMTDLPFGTNSAPFTNQLDNAHIEKRNSFHWGPRQFPTLPSGGVSPNLYTTNDYLKARMKHWMANSGPVGGTLSLERDPSPDSAGAIEGQKTWYDYAGKTNMSYDGTQSLPLLITRVLPDGSTQFRRLERDDWGNVTNEITSYSSGTNVLMRTNAYVYAAAGIDLIKAFDASGVMVVSNAYNAYHQVLTSYNALGEPTTFTYDGSNRLSSLTTPSGLVVTNTYGADGYLATQTAAGYATNSFTYANGLVFTHTDERGSTITNTWDNLGRLTSASDGLGTMTMVYDKLDLVRTVDRMGFTNGFGYDSMRRRTDSYDALGHNTHYDYCTCGSLDSVTDATGTSTTTFTYDAGGRRIGVTGPDGYWVTNALNLLGQVITTRDSGGATVTNFYNNQGLLYCVSNAWGQVSRAEFDIHDWATSSVDANNVTVTNAYDVAGRLLVTGTPTNGALQRFGYTANIAGPTSFTNALTNVTLIAYDVYGRKTNEISGGATGGTFVPLTTNSFAFEADGALATLTDGNRHLTTWKYDGFGRLTNKVDHLGANAFALAYDANSRVTSRTTPAKGTTSYGYNAVGSLTSVDHPSSADLTLQYDALNWLTNQVVAGTFTNSYTYTAAGQLASEDGPWASDTVSYSYTQRLRTGLALQQPSSSDWTVSYGWDGTKRLTNVTSGAGSFGYNYRASQPTLVSKLALPYGHYETNSFDALGRLVDTYLASSGGAILNDHAYTLNVGNQRAIQSRQGIGYTNTVDYGYDPIGQLLSAVGKEINGTNRLQEQFGYVYDAGGNLKYRTNNALVQTFTVDTLNQLTNVSRTGGSTLTVAGSTTSPATNVTVNTSNATLYADTTFAKAGFSLVDGTNSFTAIAKDSYGRSDTNAISVYLPAAASYSYDANGNLTFDGRKAFEYDDENQLVTVTRTNEWKTEFSYDGLGRMRVKKEFDGSGSLQSETRYIYDGMLVIQERDGNNASQVSYTRGQDLSGTFAGAGGIGGLLARTDHTTSSALLKTAFYHADGNGNVTALMSTNGLLLAWYQYDPYGRMLAQSGPLADANVYRFSSKESHANSGLYYYGYRFYEPNLQRWLNRDPIGEAGGINLYGFVGNYPVGAVDLFGFFESHWILRWFVPGQVAWDNAVTAWEQGEKANCGSWACMMVAEQSLALVGAKCGPPATQTRTAQALVNEAKAAARLEAAVAAAGVASSARAAAQGALWQAQMAYQAEIGNALGAATRGVNVSTLAEQVEAAAARLASASATLAQAERAEAAAKAAVAACGK